MSSYVGAGGAPCSRCRRGPRERIAHPGPRDAAAVRRLRVDAEGGLQRSRVHRPPRALLLAGRTRGGLSHGANRAVEQRRARVGQLLRLSLGGRGPPDRRVGGGRPPRGLVGPPGQLTPFSPTPPG